MAVNIDDIRAVLKSTRSDLMGKSNVVATGIGYKIINGKVTDNLSIICSVENKKAKNQLASADIIPATMDGIPLDVKASGAIYAFPDPKLKYRPASGGVSIGHYLITAGTFGCTVKRDGNRYILSNNHVLANSNSADIGDDILQPGPTDGGSRPDDIIGTLHEFIPIAWDGGGGNDSNCSFANAAANILNGMASTTGRKSRLKAVIENQPGKNLVDCAIAKPISESDIKDDILQIGNIAGVAEGTLGLSLQKFGRTTEYTTGTITQIDVTSKVSYGAGKTATFVDQLMAGNMSAGGDSGSAILNDKKEIVGLLFAGSANSTIINRIQNVFELLNVTLP
jgi:hypothetical protein